MPVDERDDDRERDHAPVEPDEVAVLADARQTRGVDREQRANAGPADEQPEHAAGERQHDALGQQLPDDAAARSADRGADRDLAPAAGGAHEQQVGDVGAGDQQHEADGAAVDQQRRLDVAADDDVANRLHAERVLRPDRRRELRAEVLRRRAAGARSPAAASRPGLSRPIAWK